MAIPHTDVGGGPTGSTTTPDLVGTTLHLVRVTPNQMRPLQRVGTHHVPFLQHPEWPNKSVLENHMRTRPHEADTHSQPMGKYVTHTVCFGAGTNSHYRGPTRGRDPSQRQAPPASQTPPHTHHSPGSPRRGPRGAALKATQPRGRGGRAHKGPAGECTTTIRPQLGVAGNHTQDPQPGQARHHNTQRPHPHRAANPSPERRGQATRHTTHLPHMHPRTHNTHHHHHHDCHQHKRHKHTKHTKPRTPPAPQTHTTQETPTPTPKRNQPPSARNGAEPTANPNNEPHKGTTGNGAPGPPPSRVKGRPNTRSTTRTDG